jgi:hypothetical protein
LGNIRSTETISKRDLQKANLFFCGDEAPLFFVLQPSRGKPFGKNLILST